MAATVPELGEFQITLAGRACTVRHQRALITWVDEQRFLSTDEPRHYGMMLWPAAIALAQEISARATEFRGANVLELGAGAGLPGIAAASAGARVVQTDFDADALTLCRENAARNGLAIEHRVADWAAWPLRERHDWVIASDILYRATLHDRLYAVFQRSVRSGGRLLIADPLRSASLLLLERMERDGWRVAMNLWTIGDGEFARRIGVFELTSRAT